MTHYDDSLTLRDARRAYFEANHFGAGGGYHDAWVKFDLGPFPIAFPNVPSRVRAVRFHDLHHLATGYATTTTGESEIAAWELGSGCADQYAAWVLNLTALGTGLALAPRATFRAFVRGRHSGNLYREGYGEALLDRRLGEVRASLKLDRPGSPATGADVASFAACVLGAGAVGLPVALTMPAFGLGMALYARLRPRAAQPA